MESLIIAAVRARLEADKAEALATLAIYNSSAVGIGEHPQHLEEMDKLLEIIAGAEDKKSSLERHFEIHAKI